MAFVRPRYLIACTLAAASCGAPELPLDAAAGPAGARRAVASPSPDPHPQFAAAGISCATCHPCGAAPVHTAAWMDPASGAFHAAQANAGLAGCQSCHGANLDGAGGTSAVSCASCHGAGWQSSCILCHGGTDNQTGAPPRATFGNDGDAVRIGAHTAHVAPRLTQPISCATCHLTPQDALSAGHLDGATATVTFAGRALAGGAAPSWDRAAASCSATWCHGAALAGGLRKTPVWTLTDGSQRTCDSCHGAPPPAPHPLNPGCETCHPGTSAAAVNRDTHLNGVVDVAPLTCSSCHGSAANAAPPSGTGGQLDTTSRAVGAHQRHLAGGAVSKPIACSQCHQVPADLLHANGTVELVFGPLATSGGAAPAWNGTSCATTYCHGGTLDAGGTQTAPIWTRVDGTQAACGTCHGTPPPPPHVQSAGCGSCHTGYTATSVDLATHLDGKLDVVLACTSCHGSPGNAAPPQGTHGETATTDRAVGAHRRHLEGGGVGKAVACGECHLVPESMTHSNGAVELSWGALARSSGAVPSWNGASCATTYCHGATLGGGANTAPSWTRVDGSQAGCGSCHGISLAAGAALPDPLHPRRADLDCGACHSGYSAVSKTAVAATHVDGVVQVSVSCVSCHGDGARAATARNPRLAAAPPAGTRGEAATSTRAVGAHQRHLTGGPLSDGIACTECHALPSDAAPIHQDGTVQLTWGPLATTRGAAPVWSRTSNTCSSTWCHGGKLTGGRDTTPIWTTVDGSQSACGTCHGVPPGSGQHGRSEHRVTCGDCHGGTYTQSVADKTRHVNGVFEVNGPRIRSWNPATRSCQPTCHGTENWN